MESVTAIKMSKHDILVSLETMRVGDSEARSDGSKIEVFGVSQTLDIIRNTLSLGLGHTLMFCYIHAECI